MEGQPYVESYLLRPHGDGEDGAVTAGPRKSETLVNGELASALRKRHPRWDRKSLVAESTGVLRSEQKRPDILVMYAFDTPSVIQGGCSRQPPTHHTTGPTHRNYGRE